MLCLLFAVMLLVTLVDHNYRLAAQSRELKLALEHAQQQESEAHVQRHQANSLRTRAEESEKEARRITYHANMRLAFQAWESNNWADTRHILQRTAQDTPSNLGREWYLLNSMVESRYQRVASLHHAILDLERHPENGQLLSLDSSGLVRWWDLQSLSQVDRWQTSKGATALALSPTDKTLAISDKRGLIGYISKVYLYDLDNKDNPKAEYHKHETTIETVEFSPDGKWIASGPRYESVQVTRLADGKTLTFPSDRRNRQLCFSPDSRYLSVLSDKNYVTVYDLNQQSVHVRFEGQPIVVSHYWLPTQPLIALCDNQAHGVSLHSVESKSKVLTVPGTISAEIVAGSPDGSTLALASSEGSLQFVHFERSESGEWSASVVGPIQALDSVVTSLEFMTDDQIAAGDEEGNIVWLNPKGSNFQRYSFDGALASGEWKDENSLQLVDAGRTPILLQIPFKDSTQVATALENIQGMVWSPDAKYRAFYNRRGELVVEDASSHELVECEPAQRGKVDLATGQVTRAILFSFDDHRLFGTGENNRFTCWRASDGVKVWDKALTNTGKCLALDEERGRVLLGGSFESLKVYDSESGSLLNELPGGSGINVIAVDCLRDRIVSGHDDATIRVRDAEFQERATIHRGHNSPVTALSLSSNSKTLLSGDRSGCIRVWGEDLQAYGTLYQSNIPSAVVRQILWSPSGKRIVAIISNDLGQSEVILWE